MVRTTRIPEQFAGPGANYQDGTLEFIVDSALVTDLAVALVTVVTARFEKARFAGEVAK